MLSACLQFFCSLVLLDPPIKCQAWIRSVVNITCSHTHSAETVNVMQLGTNIKYNSPNSAGPSLALLLSFPKLWSPTAPNFLHVFCNNPLHDYCNPHQACQFLSSPSSSSTAPVLPSAQAARSEPREASCLVTLVSLHPHLLSKLYQYCLSVSSLLSVPQTWYRFTSLSPFARLLQWLLNCHPFLQCGHSLITSCALPHILGPPSKQATAVAISFSPQLHEGFSQAVCLVPIREPCTHVHSMRPGRVRNLLQLLTVKGGSS